MSMSAELRLAPRQLALLFMVVALVSFFWHADVLGAMDRTLRAAAASRGVQLVGGRVAWHGAGLRWSDLTIQARGMTRPLMLARLELQLAWLHGPALLLAASQGNAHVQMRLQRAEHSLVVQGIRCSLPASQLAPWIPLPIPLALHGQLELHGRFSLRWPELVPMQGELQGNWQASIIEFAGRRYRLGDYQAELHDTPDGWRWMVRGGEAMHVDGQGRLHMTSAHGWQSWPLSGAVQVQPAQHLSTWVQPGRYVLAGTLGALEFKRQTGR